MIINTRYDIGHTYWVARVYQKLEDTSIVIDGKIYKHRRCFLEPSAKQKIIKGIEITVSGESLRKKYHVANVGEAEDYDENKYVTSYMSYSTNEMMFDTAEKAYSYAAEYLEKHNKEFFGSKSPDDWDT